jgi:N-acyl-D-amino-acid deacylase
MPYVSRRQFLQKTATATFTATMISSCSKHEFDIIIRHGLIFDGFGREPLQQDLGIRGDQIVAMGDLRQKTAARTIDATGFAVAPGFIDAHTHSDMTLLVNPKAESKIRQGVTVEICGNCGDSPFPLHDVNSLETITALRNEYHTKISWRDFSGYRQVLEKKGTALNVATLIGHGNLRQAVVGSDNRPPSSAELQQMKALVAEYMQAGSLGLSTGLEYMPGMFAQTDELIELARVVARFDGVYASHMRNEDVRVQEALEEALIIGRTAGVRVQISHLKASQQRNWFKTPLLLAAIDQARAQGLEVHADRYPYTAYSTSLKMLFPSWSREGAFGDFVKRLQSDEEWKKIRPFIEDKINALGSWNSILITRLTGASRQSWQGKTIAQLAEGQDPFAFVRQLMIDEQGQVSMCGFGMSEPDTEAVLAAPFTMVGSDGDAVAPYGLLGEGTPHPRFYGTFPRYLGMYIRQKKILTLAEGIRRITSLPAAKFHLPKRGSIKVGHYADIVIFDTEKILDRATFTQPHQYPEGIPYVLVNGVIVVNKGEHTGRLPGQFLERAVA